MPVRAFRNALDWDNYGNISILSEMLIGRQQTDFYGKHFCSFRNARCVVYWTMTDKETLLSFQKCWWEDSKSILSEMLWTWTSTDTFLFLQKCYIYDGIRLGRIRKPLSILLEMLVILVLDYDGYGDISILSEMLMGQQIYSFRNATDRDGYGHISILAEMLHIWWY